MISVGLFGGFLKLGELFLQKKDYAILGSILGPYGRTLYLYINIYICIYIYIYIQIPCHHRDYPPQIKKQPGHSAKINLGWASCSCRRLLSGFLHNSRAGGGEG